MLEATLLTHEQIGLYACGFLCSFMRQYIMLVLCSSGGRQNVLCGLLSRSFSQSLSSLMMVVFLITFVMSPIV